MSEIINYTEHVGKRFAVKGAQGSAAEHRYTVEKFIPKQDFGPSRGGVKAAFQIKRELHDTHSLVAASAFLETHEIAPADGAEA